MQGRKSRFRSPDDLEKIVRENNAEEIRRFFITDDNFARNRQWEPLFDRLIEMREGEGMNIGFTIQVDTLCHKIPNFIEKAARAGVRRVFIGLENINPDNLIAANKRQNKITEYRKMLQMWRDNGAITYAGYILGFPGDTRESILRDIEIIKRELPLDILEFFFLTPLPGSEDHKTLLQQGVWMDPDLNKYDLNHRVSHHGKMSDVEWEQAYRDAWHAYYTPEHMRTIMRRTAASKVGRPRTTLTTILWFNLMILYEGVHPLEGGALRLKIATRSPARLAYRESADFLSALFRRDRVQAAALCVGLPGMQGDPQRSSHCAGSLDLHRCCDRPTRRRRIREARSLPGDRSRRGCPRTQAARRCDPSGQTCSAV